MISTRKSVGTGHNDIVAGRSRVQYPPGIRSDPPPMETAQSTVVGTPGGLRTPDARAALAGALEALADLAAKADPETYATGLAFGFHSPIGAHFRHCIDHVEALIAGMESGEICYDRRARGTLVETDRRVGLETARERARTVRAIGDSMLDSSIVVRAVVTPDSGELLFDSTISREVLYVFHHTLHHTALMSAQATNMGIQSDPQAGRAPSTIALDARATRER